MSISSDWKQEYDEEKVMLPRGRVVVVRQVAVKPIKELQQFPEEERDTRFLALATGLDVEAIDGLPFRDFQLLSRAASRLNFLGDDDLPFSENKTE